MNEANIVDKIKSQLKPTREQAEEAVRTLIKWSGDDPNRDGLIDTPKRVVNSYQELFSGYNIDAAKVLGKTFANVDNYGEVVLLKDINFESCCEHHILPIIGVAHVAYIAKDRLVGLSKLARLVDVYAKRLQTQEGMTAQILKAIEDNLAPLGAMVIIDAKHYCMSMRGVAKLTSSTVTEKFSGSFELEQQRNKIYQMINR